MAIRRLNYTKRKRIAQVHARVALIQRKGLAAEFEVDLALQSYALPAEARVYVEAYRQTTWMRFEYGTVAHISRPTDRRLVEFETPDAVLFRIRITSVSPRLGLLLAEADAIRPRRPEESDDDRIPLLPVRSSDDLGEELFKLEFDSGPVLLINQKVGDWKVVTRDPTFFALVYPTVLRQILTRIVIREEYTDTDDPGDWRSDWLRFAKAFPGVGDTVPNPQNDPEPVYEWIDRAAEAFSRKYGMLNRFLGYWTKEGIAA
jgi:hypothetical protein